MANDSSKVKSLEEQLQEGRPGDTRNLRKAYDDLAKFLFDKIHPVINQGATANSRANREPLWLTDHGPEHVRTVIQRANDLLSAEPFVLSAYESYVLLLAIHFHDVGNVFGREEHERKIDEVMSDKGVSQFLGEDTLERRLVRDIAMAHGGRHNGSKDTIGALSYPLVYSSSAVRTHLLAAILRFADELADDYTRTSRFLLDNRLISADCEIYHAYADRLRRVKVEPSNHQISLVFQVNADAAKRKYAKGKSKCYLVEEILRRTLKMHKEHTYCNRYLRPYVQIDGIAVKIELCSPNYMNALHSFGFEMKESGYPDEPETLAQICPSTKDLTGPKLKQKFNELVSRGTK